MTRASRARRLATAAAYGGGGLTALGTLAVGTLAVEARLARRWVGRPFGEAGPDADGTYGDGDGAPLVLGVLGDSAADGLGADTPDQTPGAVVARGLADVSGRPVRLVGRARVGADSQDLDRQARRLLAEVVPDVVVVVVGANDVTHRVPPAEAVGFLGDAVRLLRDAGCQVVVGTCPDLGVVEPVAQPLRGLARRWSRELAAAQTVAVVEADGRSVSLGDLLGPAFGAAPAEMFSADGFHPSPAGYARVAAALLPAVASSLGVWPEEPTPGTGRSARVVPVDQAAAAAALEPGTEVEQAPSHGVAGRWARLRRRAER